jgi:hypothetical protein
MSEDYKKLFGKSVQATEGEITFGELMMRLAAQNTVQNTSAEVGADMIRKQAWLRLIVATAVRLSLVASVWLWLFDYEKWPGMLIFFVLAIFVGGVQLPTKKTVSK